MSGGNFLGWVAAIVILLFVFGIAQCTVTATPVEESAYGYGNVQK